MFPLPDSPDNNDDDDDKLSLKGAGGVEDDTDTFLNDGMDNDAAIASAIPPSVSCALILNLVGSLLRFIRRPTTGGVDSSSSAGWTALASSKVLLATGR